MLISGGTCQNILLCKGKIPLPGVWIWISVPVASSHCRPRIATQRPPYLSNNVDNLGSEKNLSDLESCMPDQIIILEKNTALLISMKKLSYGKLIIHFQLVLFPNPIDMWVIQR
jgi:hypothetical protein